MKLCLYCCICCIICKLQEETIAAWYFPWKIFVNDLSINIWNEFFSMWENTDIFHFKRNTLLTFKIFWNAIEQQFVYGISQFPAYCPIFFLRNTLFIWLYQSALTFNSASRSWIWASNVCLHVRCIKKGMAIL